MDLDELFEALSHDLAHKLREATREEGDRPPVRPLVIEEGDPLFDELLALLPGVGNRVAVFRVTDVLDRAEHLRPYERVTSASFRIDDRRAAFVFAVERGAHPPAGALLVPAEHTLDLLAARDRQDEAATANVGAYEFWRLARTLFPELNEPESCWSFGMTGRQAWFRRGD